AKLLETLARLRDMGNTVLVVEHDEETIRAADHVIDMGPRAGVHGGRIVASGTPDDVARSTASLTGAYPSRRPQIRGPQPPGSCANRYVALRGARANNLRNVSVRFPVGVFTCVTGVSGSGKSTLIIDTLLRALEAKLYRAKTPPGDHDGIDGMHHVDKVIDID